MGGCACDRGTEGGREGWKEAPNLLDVSLAKASLFYEVGDGEDSRGSIKRSPLTEHRSQQQTCTTSEKTRSPRFGFR